MAENLKKMMNSFLPPPKKRLNQAREELFSHPVKQVV
jgi:hypothetical protein